MGGIYHYDKDSGIGYYVSDQDIAEASGFLFMGMGALGAVYLIGCLIGVALISPFVTLFVLDDFIETFIANNALFFMAIGAVVAALKLIPAAAGRRVVRILFDAYIIIAVLYLALYVLHFDVGIYSWFKIADRYLPATADRTFLDALGTFESFDVVEGTWFYELACQGTEAFIGFMQWCIGQITGIDNSSLQVPAAEMNILAVLKTIGLYLALGGFACIALLLAMLLVVVVILVTVALPYVLAIAVMVLCNKLIFRIHTVKIRSRGTEEARQARFAPLKEAFEQRLRAGHGSMEQEFEIAREMAKQGNPFAQIRLAQCFLHGEGTPEDEKQAFKWYHKAAVQGVPKAQMMIAFFYFDGIGVRQNKLMAKAWIHATLKNRDYLSRQRDKQNVMQKIALVCKKTRYLDQL